MVEKGFDREVLKIWLGYPRLETHVFWGLLTIARDVLLLESIEESKIGDLDHNPADQAGDGGNVKKPSEDDGGVIANREIHQRRREQAERNCPEWSSPAIALQEYLGCVSVGAQTVKRAGSKEYAGGATADC